MTGTTALARRTARGDEHEVWERLATRGQIGNPGCAFGDRAGWSETCSSIHVMRISPGSSSVGPIHSHLIRACGSLELSEVEISVPSVTRQSRGSQPNEKKFKPEEKARKKEPGQFLKDNRQAGVSLGKALVKRWKNVPFLRGKSSLSETPHCLQPHRHLRPADRFRIRRGPRWREGAIDPEFTLQAGEQKFSFKRSELMTRFDIETLSFSNDPTYPGQAMSYKAVRATALFDGMTIADDAVIQFKCLDGFSAPISKERLLNKLPAKSLAYIAIEEADKPWPAVKPGGPSAGPFYLVWRNSEASFIGPEEWPFQLAAFEVKGTLESLYPAIFPDAKLKPMSEVRQGFAVFTKNCFACHTLNKAGAAEIGPDLNVVR